MAPTADLRAPAVADSAAPAGGLAMVAMATAMEAGEPLKDVRIHVGITTITMVYGGNNHS